MGAWEQGCREARERGSQGAGERGSRRQVGNCRLQVEGWKGLSAAGHQQSAIGERSTGIRRVVAEIWSPASTGHINHYLTKFG